MSDCYIKSYQRACYALNYVSREEVNTKYVVYVLFCRQKTYYIGITTNIKRRIIQHFIGQGSKWTKRYYPIEVYGIYPTNDPSLEQKMTDEYIRQFGKNRVRGGSFCVCGKRPARPRARVFWDNTNRRFGIRLKNDKHLDEALAQIKNLDPRPSILIQNKDFSDEEPYTNIILP